MSDNYSIESLDDDTVIMRGASFTVHVSGDSWRAANGLAHFIGEHLANDARLRGVRICVGRLLEEIERVTFEIEKYGDEREHRRGMAKATR